MGLKRGRKAQGQRAIESLAKGVQDPAIENNPNRQKRRPDAPLPSEGNQGGVGSARRKAKEYEHITVTGSKGETYKIAVPASYIQQVPRVWEWNEERYIVAEYIAKGIPFSQIPDQPDVTIRSRMTIYGWLEHPEFKEHIDALIMETGWASRRERLNNMQRLNNMLFTKVARELDSVKLTDKSLGAVLSALQMNAKFIAQEKGEFVEESKVTQDTNVTAKVSTVSASMDAMLASKSAEERARLEEEFDKQADDLIRSITGDK